ncbi:hypothetical protein C0995_009942 [Termitomyces sp. Mi166|nr:hypothetical protein C0995_009942 [Termitomyces sp. Mi166\
MIILSYSKNSFSIGNFPLAFSIITFILQLAQEFLPASSSPRLTVARKTSPSPPPLTPTPTTPLTPTPTLSSEYLDVSTTVRPLLASLILVVLGTTYIRRKSGTIFTPLTPPRKERDPPQPPTPPNPNEDDYPADEQGEGDENRDDDSDGDSSSEDDEDRPEDDESDDSSDDDPEDPENPSGSSNIEDTPPPFNPDSWQVLFLAILYLAGIITLAAKFSTTPIKRIINSLSRHINNIPIELTLNVRKIVDCLLVWLDQSLLGLYDEMMWINNEGPPRPAFDIGMRSFRSWYNGTLITLHATDELHELKHALLEKIETVSRAPSAWASQVCPLFRSNDNDQTSHFNSIASNLTLMSTRPPSSPLKGEAFVPKPAATSSIHSILGAAMAYGVIGAFFQMLRNAHARRARIQQDFGEEGTTIFNENGGSTMMDISGENENEDPEEEVTCSNILQGPDSVPANERYVQEISEQERSHGNDNMHLREAEASDMVEVDIAYTTALSISGTFASAQEVRVHETTNPSTISTHDLASLFLPPHETSPEERTHEVERCSVSDTSTISDIIARSINGTPARAALPETHETANINDSDLPITLPPPNEYSNKKLEDTEVGEEEDDIEQGRYIQEEDWYEEEEAYGDEYPGFYEDEEGEASADASLEEHESSEERDHYVQEEDVYEENLYGDEYPGFYEDEEGEASADASLEEHESSEERDHYVQEEDVYEEENLYGDEYPGFYDDEDIEEEDSQRKNDATKNENKCLNDEKPEEELGEIDMDIEESEPSICYIGTPETFPQRLRSTSNNDHISAQTIIMQSVAGLEMTRKRFMEREARLATPLGGRARSKARQQTKVSTPQEDQQEMILQMMELERVRQRFVEEEEARLKAAGKSSHFPDAEPIEGSDISIYFRRRPSSRFQYTEEDSLEGQSAAPVLPTGTTEERLVQMRALVEKAYSSHDYDPSQIDALTRWHLDLKNGEDSC